MKLEAGMVAVVTGGASGIGLALAEALLGRGLSVAVADVEQAALDALATRLPNDRVLLQLTDVASQDEVEALRKAALARFGRIDLVVNNAGVFSRFAPMWEIDLKEWQWVLSVNLWGVIHGIRAFVPHLVTQRSGHIVNVASFAGVLSLPGNGPYNASKHGVVTLSEGLKAELEQAGVDVGVSVVLPSLVATNIRASARNRPPELTMPGELADSTVPDPSASGVIAPDVVARQIIAAVEANRLHVATHPGGVERARTRIDPLLANLAIV